MHGCRMQTLVLRCRGIQAFIFLIMHLPMMLVFVFRSSYDIQLQSVTFSLRTWQRCPPASHAVVAGFSQQFWRLNALNFCLLKYRLRFIMRILSIMKRCLVPALFACCTERRSGILFVNGVAFCVSFFNRLLLVCLFFFCVQLCFVVDIINLNRVLVDGAGVTG